MKILAFIITLLFFCVNSYANEKVSKLNELYLSGVLDKSSYMSSLENLGVNTSNEIFENLFDLFSDKTLDIETYEKSLSNLISLSDTSKADKNSSSKQDTINNNDKAVKIYKVSNCKGRTELCKALAPIEFPFFKEDNQVIVDKKTIQALIDSDISLQRIMNSQNFFSNDKFDHIITIRHTQGFLLDLKFGGYMEGSDFYLTNLSLRANGTEVNSADLELF
jgi:hypothetical protein